MKVALPTLRRTNWPFILLAALVQFVFAPHALAVSVPYEECTRAFNRLSGLIDSLGEAGMCRNQQQVLNAIDEAAAACAGIQDMGAVRSEFMANSRRCPTEGGAQGGGGYERPAPPANNGALNRARADGDRAGQFLKDMQKCDQISDPDQRTTCRSSTTKAYQGNASGSGTNTNSRTGGKGGGSVSPGPDDDPDQKPKALPPPKDPGIDYSGQSCSYFTRPAVEDEVRLNYYAKGSCVSYGQSSYECGDDGRWKRRGPAEVIKCKTAEESEGSSGEPLGRWYIPRDGEVRDPFRGM